MKENFLKDQRKCQSYKSTLQRENGRVRKTGGGQPYFLQGKKTISVVYLGPHHLQDELDKL